MPKHPILILRTTDGGKNWRSQNQSYFINAFSSDIWRCIQFVSPEVGYGRFSYHAVPDSTQFLHKTLDGGITWQQLPLNQKDFWTIRFYNEKIGLACWLGNSPIYLTIDGGQTWTKNATNLKGGWSADVDFFPNDPSKVLAAFYKSIQIKYLIFSSDTGKSWVEISAPDIGQFHDIEMVADKHGWVVGESGIIHTSTGGVTSVTNAGKSVTRNFEVLQNYPNPFNSATAISFQLPYETHVMLKIYNIRGEDIRTLVNHNMMPGMKQVEWNGTNYSGSKVASGIYIYHLIARDFRQAYKMTLIY